MLGQTPLLTDQPADPVWNLAARSQRIMLQLPIRVDASDSTASVGRPSIEPRAGRFVCWRLPAAVTVSAPSAEGGQRRSTALPEATPRVFRRGQVTTDQLRWELERVVPGTDVKEGEGLYQLTLRPDRLRALRPEPPRMGRDQSREAFEQARRDFRRQMEQFRERYQRIRNLPEQFTAPSPPHLWAVFEIRRQMREVDIEGVTPEPWTVPLLALEHARQLAGQRGNRPRVQQAGQAGRGQGGEPADPMQAVLNWAQANHPLTHRLLAQALAEGQALEAMQPDGPRTALAKQLLRSPHKAAQQRTVQALLAVDPRRGGPALAALLKDAVDRGLGKTPGALLKHLFAVEASNPTQMVASANTLLHQPAGPPADAILQSLLAQLAGSRRDRDAMRQAAIEGMTFSDLKGARQKTAIAAVVDAAPAQPLARAWLGGKLLAPAGGELAKPTLQAIARRTPAGARNKGEAPRFIPLTDRRHPLIDLLAEQDESRRNLAWAALPGFAVYPPEAGDRDARRRDWPRVSGEQGKAILSAITDAGLAQSPTPAALVRFLSAQGQTNAIATALLTVIANGKGPALAKASEAVRQVGRPMREAFAALSAKQQAEVAKRLYAGEAQDQPTVAVLLTVGPRRDRVARWFAQRVAAGELPEPAAWVEPAGGEDRLLQLVRQGSNADTRQAVATALVAGAGGTSGDARSLAQRFKALKEGDSAAATQPNSDAAKQAFVEAWAQQRQAIFARQLQSAAGRYRLALVPDNSGQASPQRAAPGQSDNDTPGLAYRRQVLGQVELVADGQSVRSATRTLPLSVGPRPATLQVHDPTELKSFAAQMLAEVSLPSDAVILQREGEGWQGTLRIAGRPWQLRLERLSP
jgi:hypothetical protein